MTDQKHRLLNILDNVIDYLINFFIVYTAYLIISMVYVYKQYVPLKEARSTYLFLFVTLVCIAATFLYNYNNVYQSIRTHRTRFFIGRILLSNFEFAIVMTLLILLFGNEPKPYYSTWLLITVLLSSVVMISKKICMIFILKNLRSNHRNVKHVLLVTDSQEMADEYMEEILDNPHFGYSVIGYVGNLGVIGLPHLGTTADLDRILTEYRPDEVIMAFETVRKKVVTKYVAICNDHCIKVLFVPAICGYFKSPKQVRSIGALPVIDIRSNPLDNPTNRFAKRLLDILASAVLLILTSPLMLFTAIGVRISSPGPIFFKQVRVGRNNREFYMYKFRSMRVNDTQQTGWSTENDPRKTRFGAFIRKFALDELPQFYNVFKGDMSLVGPRPEVPFYVEKFKAEIPLYMLKHSVRPGITGLAQIKGLRGDTSIQARIDEDIEYIENWSFWEDIRILILTPFCAVNRQEKYAAREAKEEKRSADRARAIKLREELENGQEGENKKDHDNSEKEA